MASKAILLFFDFFLLRGVRSPDLHTASLVGQDWEETIAMGVQLTYKGFRTGKQSKNKDLYKYQLYGIKGYTPT